MNTSLSQLDWIRRVTETPTNGFVGIVDEILQLCQFHGIRIEWVDNRCVVSPLAEAAEAVVLPLRKSGLRAILARVATLCAEQGPRTFNPYGGQGELFVGTNPPTLIKAAWVNTTVEQKLTLVATADTVGVVVPTVPQPVEATNQLPSHSN